MTKLATYVRTLGAVVSAAVLTAASCESRPPAPPTETKTDSQPPPAEDAGGDADAGPIAPTTAGPRAPAVFMLSGLKGYTEPCGCTLDVMLGGLDRIAGYIDAAKPLFDAVTIVDGGDMLFEKTSVEEHELPQERARVDLVTAAVADIGVQVTVPGEKDFALGTAFYVEKIAATKAQPIAANLTVDGLTIEPSKTIGKALYVGVVDPALYDGIKGVKATNPEKALAAHAEAVAAASVSILIVHGDVVFAKKMLQAVPGADFALVGHGPRETDQVDAIADGFTLEPYDQGRYLGILKLFNVGDAPAQFVDAHPTSKAELDKIDRQIEHVNKSINAIPPATPGNEPEMLINLRQRLEDLRARREQIKHAAVEVPPDKPSFYWSSVPLEPGVPVDADLEKQRLAYNAKLKELNAAVEREVIPAPPGTAEYIGSDACASCHQPATTFWKNTAHSRAWKTLVDRDKDFDNKCVGCHSVGYEQPGGSVMGKFQYPGTFYVTGSDQPFELQKNLVDVGCESCHGPGSKHIAVPSRDGKPQHIIVDPDATQCGTCHVPEHSPRFNYDVYVHEITGPGHELTPR